MILVLCRWFSSVFPRASSIRDASAICAAFVVLGVVASGYAQEATPEKATKEYARAIARTQADLDGGKVAEAQKGLETTNKSLRGFEYEYLLARARAATGKGAAPDLIRTITLPKVETRYGVLNEVNRQLVFICRDGGLVIHDLTAPKAPARSASHGKFGAIWAGAFSRDGKTFVAGHESGDVVVWDSKTWKARHTVSLGEKWPVRELAVAPDGSAIVAESKTKLELWSLAGGKAKKIADVGERYNFGEGLAFSPKGDLVATGGMFDVVLHDAKTGEKKKSMRHASYTMGLEFSPDGKRIASAPRGNVNRFLAVFDVAQGKPLFNAGPFQGYIVGMAFTPDGKRIAATGVEKLVRLFDSTTGEIILTLNRPAMAYRPGFSRDGRLLGWSEQAGYRYIDLGKKPANGK
jgi:tricorn protease-like protein